MLWRGKKPLIDKIEKMTVTSKTYADVHIFNIHLDKSFSQAAKDGLKPVLEELILTTNEKFCPDSYWLVYAFDYEQFECESEEIQQKLLCNYPVFKYVSYDGLHIAVLLREMNAHVLETLKTANIPFSDILGMDAMNASFFAFTTEDIENILMKISQKDIYTDDAVNIFYKEQIIIHIFYFDSIGAKRHEITISCIPERRNEIKNCLIEVFNSHDIQLEFDL